MGAAEVHGAIERARVALATRDQPAPALDERAAIEARAEQLDRELKADGELRVGPWVTDGKLIWCEVLWGGRRWTFGTGLLLDREGDVAG